MEHKCIPPKEVEFISELSTITIKPILPNKDGVFQSEQKQVYTRGTVVSKGITCMLSATVGDEVIFGEFSGTEFDFEEETYKVLNQEEVKITIPKQ